MYAFAGIEGLGARGALEALVPAEAGYVEDGVGALAPVALKEGPAAEGGGPSVMVGG